jgi:hypothetical protein
VVEPRDVLRRGARCRRPRRGALEGRRIVLDLSPPPLGWRPDDLLAIAPSGRDPL